MIAEPLPFAAGLGRVGTGGRSPGDKWLTAGAGSKSRRGPRLSPTDLSGVNGEAPRRSCVVRIMLPKTPLANSSGEAEREVAAMVDGKKLFGRDVMLPWQ